jgi:hypothetical protein
MFSDCNQAYSACMTILEPFHELIPPEDLPAKPETERAYWQARLATLESLLRELILKNERLRQEKAVSGPIGEHDATIR